VLLVSTPIEQTLDRLSAKAAEYTETMGKESTPVLLIRWCVSEMRLGIKAAEEMWETCAATSDMTGWSQPTLSKHAAAIADGEDVPHEWAGMQARLAAGGGYLIRPSTVPPKPPARKRAS
jgi:hypothetical protein